MIKKVMVLLFVLVCTNGYSQFNIPNFGWHMGGGTAVFLVGHNNKLYHTSGDGWYAFTNGYPNIQWCKTIPQSSLSLDKNGFLRFQDEYQTGDDADYLILSPKYFIVFQGSWLLEWEETYTKQGNLKFDNLFIKSIKANDYLIENGIHYSPQGFLKRFREDGMIYHNRTLPFAIGTSKIKDLTIDIEFETEAMGMLLLNGFIDIRRPHLYKDNARIKEFTIIIDGEEKRYTLADEIRFQEITFAKPAKKIVMKIASYYQGAKYQDICLSSICPVFNSNSKEYTSLNRNNSYSTWGSRIK